MADDRNPMDDVLRRYAQERRREIADIPLHPANRAALQREVARRYPDQTTQAKLPWTRLFWPRLAFAGGISVLLAFAAAVLWKAEDQPAHYALSTDSDSRRPQAPSPATSDDYALGDKKNEQLVKPGMSSGRTRTLEKNVKQATQPSPTASPQEIQLQERQTVGKDKESLSFEKRQLNEALAQNPAAAAPQPTADTLADLSKPVTRSEFESAQSEDSVQKGAPKVETLRRYGLRPPSEAKAQENVAEGVAPSPNPPTDIAGTLNNTPGEAYYFRFDAATNAVAAGKPVILSSFTLHRDEKKLALYEADGSAYTGELREGSPSGSRGDQSNNTALGVALEQPVLGQRLHLAYPFTAHGTNLTLNQPIAIEGTLHLPENIVAAKKDSPALADGRATAPPVSAGAASADRGTNWARMRGLARIGSTSSITLDVLGRAASGTTETTTLLAASAESSANLSNFNVNQWFKRTRSDSEVGRVLQTSGTPVLPSFVLTLQNGRAQIVDADGSVYLGSYSGDAPRNDSAQFGERLKVMSEQDAYSRSNQVVVAFSVSGTNRTMNQLVTFSGNAMVDPGQLQTPVRVAGTAGRPSGPPRIRDVRGRARVGAQELEIEAIAENR